MNDIIHAEHLTKHYIRVQYGPEIPKTTSGKAALIKAYSSASLPP